MSYGHALKTAGRLADGIAAYRRSIEQKPQTGRGLLEWSASYSESTTRFHACARIRERVVESGVGCA